MSQKIKTKTICVNSICKNGKDICCHECNDFSECTDPWKCEQHEDFYEQCKTNRNGEH